MGGYVSEYVDERRRIKRAKKGLGSGLGLELGRDILVRARSCSDQECGDTGVRVRVKVRDSTRVRSEGER